MDNDTFALVPDELKQRRQWVCWRLENGAKVPYSPRGNYRASSTKPSSWGTYIQALKTAQARGDAGIGYVFTADDPYTGIDLDKCIDQFGDVAGWAESIISQASSYSEISPSGRGVKMWVRGASPESIKTTTEPLIEVYSWGRFFTVTGRHLEGTPETIEDAQALLDNLFSTYKPAPAPRHVTSKHAQSVQNVEANDYLMLWKDRVIERAKTIVSRASAGGIHNARIKAGRLLGGLVAIGLLDDETAIDTIYDERVPAKNQAREKRTIADAVKYGKEYPLEAPEPPKERVEPIIDAHGIACCPEHNLALFKSRKKGWYCQSRKAETRRGFCDYWWDGEGYTPPSVDQAASADEVQATSSGDSNLTKADRAVLGYIAEQAGFLGWSRPSTQEIANAVAVDRRSVYRCILKLEGLGYIHSIPVDGYTTIRVLRLPDPVTPDCAQIVQDQQEENADIFQMSPPFKEEELSSSIGLNLLTLSVQSDDDSTEETAWNADLQFSDDVGAIYDPASAWKPQDTGYTGRSKRHISQEASISALDAWRCMQSRWREKIPQAVVEQSDIDGAFVVHMPEPATQNKRRRKTKAYSREELVVRLAKSENAAKRYAGTPRGHGCATSARHYRAMLERLDEAAQTQTDNVAARWETTLAEREQRITILLDAGRLLDAYAEIDYFERIDPDRWHNWRDVAALISEAQP